MLKDINEFLFITDLIADYFCALFRPVMLKAVLDLVSEHIPNLEALNLDGNKLLLIDKLSVLSKKFTKLKILYLGDNKVIDSTGNLLHIFCRLYRDLFTDNILQIKEINQLDVIKDLKLEELKLAGNPLCNKYKSRQNDYIR